MTSRPDARVRRSAVALVCAGAAAACVPAGAQERRPPTFSGEIAPILQRRCASCHRSGGPAPFSLLDYETAAALAPRLAEVVRRGTMPPWLPEPGDVRFSGERRVVPDELDLLVRWSDAGAPPGDLSRLPPPPVDEGGWVLGEPDLVVEMPFQFAVPPAGSDIFRNFVVPIPTEARRWVRGLAVRFSDPAVVHHAMFTFDETPSSRRLDDRDEAPGFDGMGTSFEALGPQGFLLGWTPGREPALAPRDLAWPLDAGTDLVIQAHIRPRGAATRLGAAVALYFAERPPASSPFTLRLGTHELNIPPGAEAYERTDRYELPVDVELLGLYPHAHYLGKRISLTAVRPDSTRVTVLSIPDWDFNWQDAYRLETPLALPAGTRLEARFVYDNTPANPRNPHRPPRRVVYGPASSDEMGELWLQVVPRRSGDLARLAEDFSRKYAADQVASWNFTLGVRPGDPMAHLGLGTVAQGGGRHADAMRHFRAALAAQPENVAARYNLALSLEATGRTSDAIAEYAAVLSHEPDHPDAHNNLGALAAADGRIGEAIRHFELAVHADARHSGALNNLGNALRQSGDLEGAVRHLRRAIALRPGYPEAHFNLGLALRRLGDPSGSVRGFRKAAEQRPSWSLPRALAAWTLATHPDPTVRDPTLAVQLATDAVTLDGARDPLSLDVLAAAYAAAGEFARALAAEARAIELAEQWGESGRSLVSAFRERMERYRDQQPWVAPDD